jgi:hypothetical protein
VKARKKMEEMKDEKQLLHFDREIKGCENKDRVTA